jgi:hypothetical protein
MSNRTSMYRVPGVSTSKSDRQTVGGMIQFKRDARSNAPDDGIQRDAQTGAPRRDSRFPLAAQVHLPDSRFMLLDPHGIASGNGLKARQATIARVSFDLAARLVASPLPALDTRDGIAARPDLPAALAAPAPAPAPAPVLVHGTPEQRARVAATHSALLKGANRAARIRRWIRENGWE